MFISTSGLGNGIHYVGFVTAVNRYFHRYRAIANIISTIGLTFGMAVYAAAVPVLISSYGWKGTLLLLGGVSYNLCALACTLFPTPERAQKKSILNMKVLLDKYFIMFGVHLILCNLSSGVVFLHLPALVLSNNIKPYVSSLALTVYGVSNCVAKVMFSLANYLLKPDNSTVYTVSLTIFGIGMILLASYANEIWILAIVVILGFTYSVSGGHYLEVIVGLVGTENVSDGLGFGQIAKAAGSLLSGPVAGKTATTLFTTARPAPSSRSC